VKDHLSARLTLLDAQIVDRDRLPIGRVDDLELRFPANGDPPQVARVLTGSQALGERIGRSVGSVMASVSSRLRAPGAGDGPSSFDARLISELEPMIRLQAQAGELDSIAQLEHWLAANFVERLPGTGHEDK
jgi:hypothetical protein